MFIVDKKPKSITAESYRTLRTNIQYSSFDKEIRVIVVTSSEAGEGKSTTAGNLAISFSQAQKKTIIIDCDLRKPSLHKKFKISNMTGLSDLLKGRENLGETVHAFNEYLDVLTSGKIPPNPSEMLGSRAMEHLIQSLKNEYEMIILDSAPLQAVTDAQILSTKADGTILVVRAEKTKRDSVRQAKELLKKVDANILGVVLNGVENIRKKYYYYYGSEERQK
ncbi:capsular exopolysaccharide family [Clostridium sp. DSM 8431]|uniref:CpsD/CapB family tyrosine-protein kinase n=1 Tax=Clostridium sp. DSM 8431 TaxID=1761781 RepID=UPI0008DF4900|nr:CpsD/CapB family tyrosine-protein kinase [Clostridium sp. DSM 8431]SFU86247.1 capsular exopolysaccharide family [Clostridium sp. DSM 8431]